MGRYDGREGFGLIIMFEIEGLFTILYVLVSHFDIFD